MRSSLRGWKVMGGRNLIFVPTQPLISSFAVCPLVVGDKDV